MQQLRSWQQPGTQAYNKTCQKRTGREKTDVAKKDKPSQSRVGRSGTGLATGSGAPEVRARTLEDAIGAQVHDFRKAAGLTVSELAASAGVSTAMVSKIENGQISASLSTLNQLASALNMPLTMLLATYEGRRGCTYVKKGQGLDIQRRGTKVGHQYQQLGQSFGGNIAFEPYLITISKGAEPYTQFRHEGLELIYMLTGEVNYLHGDRSYHLEPGDCILFDSADFHGPETLIKLPMTYLSIIVYQRK
jgi:transcriptional regulator with XRE-family HTH domain